MLLVSLYEGFNFSFVVISWISRHIFLITYIVILLICVNIYIS
jgi:hypothetical protein